MKQFTINRHRNYLFDFFVAGFLCLVLLTPLVALSWNEKSMICMLSFLINGIIFSIGTFNAQKRYAVSMELLYWLFMLFFMYLAPVIQYMLMTFPWHSDISDNEIVVANAIILIFNITFIFGSWSSRRVRVRKVKKSGGVNSICSKFELNKKTRAIMTGVVCLLTIYSVSKTGLAGIILSRNQAAQVFYSGNNSAIELIVEAVVPSLITYVVAEAAQSMVNKQEGRIRFCILFVCLLVCFFPTTLPRYKVATIFGAIFLVLFPQINKGSRFFWLFSLAFFIGFPLLSSFRRDISWEGVQAVFEEDFFRSYTSGDYDAYRMLVSAIRYTQAQGSTMGYQLLGVLLFYVPKALWTSKPIGSGAMVIKAELGNSTFSNVSCPFIAEGLVNFGIVGVVLFALFLGVILSKLDESYWKHAKEEKKTVFSPYLFVVFMLFFIMRGDLLSGFAYVSGFIITGYTLKMISKLIH